MGISTYYCGGMWAGESFAISRMRAVAAQGVTNIVAVDVVSASIS